MPIHVRSLIFSGKSCDVLMRGSSFIKYCLLYKKRSQDATKSSLLLYLESTRCTCFVVEGTEMKIPRCEKKSFNIFQHT